MFFGGSWSDGFAAAACGLLTGVLQILCEQVGEVGSVGIDMFVGIATGMLGGFFYSMDYFSESACLSSIFLGTLYWFFYGTAFVIGLLEIIAGELVTGVTRSLLYCLAVCLVCLVFA